MLSKSSESEMRCLVDSDIHKLIDSKTFNFRGSHPITHQIDLHPFVQRTSLSLRRSRNVKRTTTHTAASLDLPIAGNAFLVKEKVLPFKKKIIDLLPELQLEVLSLKDEGALLLKGQTYLVYVGKIDLPSHLRGHLSPKSSIGRIDLMVRGVVDGCGLYDTIPSGQKSDLWLEITPQSFNVRIRKGLALTQLMLFTSDAKQMLSSNETVDDEEKVDISSLEITKRILYDKDGEVLPVSLHRGAVVLSLSIPSNSKELAGYEAKHTNEVVNLSNIGKHERDDFFRPIRCDGKGRLTLEKDRFYILATKERISVPLEISGEMIPFSHLVGELRAHYAGFFDPGFGYGTEGERKGTIAVLEVRPHETITIYDGQPICLMEFFKNTARPAKPYGYSGNNYAEQCGPKLAKYFS